jgi:hypothetical protein
MIELNRIACQRVHSVVFSLRETRGARSANQRTRNQRKQIPSAPKLRTERPSWNFTSQAIIGHNLQFLSPPLRGPLRFILCIPEGSSRHQAIMLARSLLRAAPARATARQSLRQNSVRTTTPSVVCEAIGCSLRVQWLSAMCSGLLEWFANDCRSEPRPHPPVLRTRALRSI